MLGSGTVKLKLEDNNRVKYEVRDIPIILTDAVDVEPPAQVTGLGVTAISTSLMKTEILKSNIGAGCCEVDPGR